MCTTCKDLQQYTDSFSVSKMTNLGDFGAFVHICQRKLHSPFSVIMNSLNLILTQILNLLNAKELSHVCGIFIFGFVSQNVSI